MREGGASAYPPKEKPPGAAGRPEWFHRSPSPRVGGGEAQLPGEAATTSGRFPGFPSFCGHTGALKMGASSDDGKGVVWGKGLSVWVQLGGGVTFTKQTKRNNSTINSNIG